MTLDPHIRRATEADLDRIFEIRFAVRENRLSNPNAVTRDDCRWFIAGPGIWLWEEAGVVKGFSASDTRDGSIWALFVDPAHEGRGIGRALLHAAVNVLRDTGYDAATLPTDVGTRAARFYREVGWIEDGLTAKGEQRFRLTL
jgi:GNAT superfamily N-acetyltransferase